MSEAEAKSTVDMVAETRDQMTDYLCVCGVKDVGIIVGALATGMLAGYVGHQVLRGRWRSVPVVVGLALTGASGRRAHPSQYASRQFTACATP